MSARPLLVDFFCKAGGAGAGYQRAGFDVVGVDIEPQPNYPFPFIQADALEVMRQLIAWPRSHQYMNVIGNARRIAALHASPPCQAYSWSARRWGKEWPDLVEPTRVLLRQMRAPYVIENVPGAPLINPIRLCGEMFGLGVIRHRLFESSVPLQAPAHKRHKPPVTRPAADDPTRMVQRSQYCTVAGHGGEGASFSLSAWRKAMGINWMTRDELTQAIPPAYTELIGKQLLRAL